VGATEWYRPEAGDVEELKAILGLFTIGRSGEYRHGVAESVLEELEG
jgi:hypothetical protein